MSDRPQRKHPRLKTYDYGTNGYYFVTINTKDNQPILSKIVDIEQTDGSPPITEVHLTQPGTIVATQLMELEKRFIGLRIENYVIMPTHIHAIIVLNTPPEGKCPTLMDAVCMFKSVSARMCNRQRGVSGIAFWQTSFYEKVIRNEEAYLMISQYIMDNPVKWKIDKYYREPL